MRAGVLRVTWSGAARRRGGGLGRKVRRGQAGISSIWCIVNEGLRQRGAVLIIGVAFIGGGLLMGPGGHATAVGRFLAPYLRDNPVVVYAVIAALFLLWLAFIPGINNLGQVLVIVVLAVPAVVGVEILRRQTV